MSKGRSASAADALTWGLILSAGAFAVFKLTGPRKAGTTPTPAPVPTPAPTTPAPTAPAAGAAAGVVVGTVPPTTQPVLQPQVIAPPAVPTIAIGEPAPAAQPLIAETLAQFMERSGLVTYVPPVTAPVPVAVVAVPSLMPSLPAGLSNLIRGGVPLQPALPKYATIHTAPYDPIFEQTMTRGELMAERRNA